MPDYATPEDTDALAGQILSGARPVETPSAAAPPPTPASTIPVLPVGNGVPAAPLPAADTHPTTPDTDALALRILRGHQQIHDTTQRVLEQTAEIAPLTPTSTGWLAPFQQADRLYQAANRTDPATGQPMAFGPGLDDLQRRRALAFLDAQQNRPQVATDLAAQAAALKHQKALLDQAVADAQKNGLSDVGVAALKQRQEIYRRNVTTFGALQDQFVNLDQTRDELARTMPNVPLHRGIYLPQEPHDSEQTLQHNLETLTAALGRIPGIGPAINSFIPKQFTESTLNARQAARAAMQIHGDYPKLPDLPANATPAQVQQYVTETQHLRLLMRAYMESVGIGKPFPGIDAYQGWLSQLGRPANPNDDQQAWLARLNALPGYNTVSAWQAQIAPIMWQGLNAEAAIDKKQNLLAAMGKDASVIGAGEILGLLGGKVVKGLAGRFLESAPGQALANRTAANIGSIAENRIGSMGASRIAALRWLAGKMDKALAQQALTPIEQLVRGTALAPLDSAAITSHLPEVVGHMAGATLGGAGAGATGAALSGGSPGEIAQAAVDNAKIGAGLGAAHLVLGSLGRVWSDDHVSPEAVNESAAKLAGYYKLNLRDASLLHDQLTQISALGPVARVKEMRALGARLQSGDGFRSASVAAGKAPASINPGPGFRLQAGIFDLSQNLRELNPDQVQGLAQEFTDNPVQGNPQFSAAQQQLGALGEIQTQRAQIVAAPIPETLRDGFTADYNKSPAAKNIQALGKQAKQFETSDPPMASLLARAAVEMQEDFATGWKAQKGIAESPGGRPQQSVWRELTPEQRAKLPNALQQALIAQDITNSEQALHPETRPYFTVQDVGQFKTRDALQAYADYRYNAAQEFWTKTLGGEGVEAAPLRWLKGAELEGRLADAMQPKPGPQRVGGAIVAGPSDFLSEYVPPARPVEAPGPLALPPANPLATPPDQIRALPPANPRAENGAIIAPRSIPTPEELQPGTRLHVPTSGALLEMLRPAEAEHGQPAGTWIFRVLDAGQEPVLRAGDERFLTPDVLRDYTERVGAEGVSAETPHEEPPPPAEEGGPPAETPPPAPTAPAEPARPNSAQLAAELDAARQRQITLERDLRKNADRRAQGRISNDEFKARSGLLQSQRRALRDEVAQREKQLAETRRQEQRDQAQAAKKAAVGERQAAKKGPQPAVTPEPVAAPEAAPAETTPAPRPRHDTREEDLTPGSLLHVKQNDAQLTYLFRDEDKPGNAIVHVNDPGRSSKLQKQQKLSVPIQHLLENTQREDVNRPTTGPARQMTPAEMLREREQATDHFLARDNYLGVDKRYHRYMEPEIDAVLARLKEMDRHTRERLGVPLLHTGGRTETLFPHGHNLGSFSGQLERVARDRYNIDKGNQHANPAKLAQNEAELHAMLASPVLKEKALAPAATAHPKEWTTPGGHYMVSGEGNSYEILTRQRSKQTGDWGHDVPAAGRQFQGTFEQVKAEALRREQFIEQQRAAQQPAPKAAAPAHTPAERDVQDLVNARIRLQARAHDIAQQEGRGAHADTARLAQLRAEHAETAHWLTEFPNNYEKQHGAAARQALEAEAQRRLDAARTGKPAPKAAAPAAKPLWEMRIPELDAAHEAATAAERSLLVRLFGADGAKRFLALEGTANSSYASGPAIDKASAELEQMKATLSPADHDALHGIGTDEPAAEEIADFRRALNDLDTDSAEGLGDSLKWAITRVGQETDPAKMTETERLAYAQLREAARITTERGFDPKIVTQAAIQGSASRFSDKNDALFMLRRFLAHAPEAADVPPAPKPAPAALNPAPPTRRDGSPLPDTGRQLSRTLTDEDRAKAISALFHAENGKKPIAHDIEAHDALASVAHLTRYLEISDRPAAQAIMKALEVTREAKLAPAAAAPPERGQLMDKKGRPATLSPDQVAQASAWLKKNYLDSKRKFNEAAQQHMELARAAIEQGPAALQRYLTEHVAAALPSKLRDHLGLQWIDTQEAAAPVAEKPAARSLADKVGAAPEPAATGTTTRVDAGKEHLKARYAVYDVRQLEASHTDTFAENPNYPQELQPRDRTSAASQAQIANLKAIFDFHHMNASPTARDGAPIVGPDGLVESGNGRTIALRQLYAGNEARAIAYKDALIDRAEEFGLDRDRVAKVEQPIMVRVRQGNLVPAERVRLADLMNERGTLEPGTAEVAKRDAGRLTPEVMRLFNAGAKLDFSGEASQPFVRKFMEGLSVEERGNLFDKDGDLSLAGQNRIRNAIFRLAYGNDEMVARLSVETDAPAKNVLNGLLQAADKIAAHNAQIARGEVEPIPIAPEIGAAAEVYGRLKRKGLSLDRYFESRRDGDLFGENGPELTPFQKQLLVWLDANKGSAKKISSQLRDYTERAQEFAAGQNDLFGGEASKTPLGGNKPTVEEVWAASLRGLEELERNEPGLFDEPQGHAGNGGVAEGAAGAGAAQTEAARLREAGEGAGGVERDRGGPSLFRVGAAESGNRQAERGGDARRVSTGEGGAAANRRRLTGTLVPVDVPIGGGAEVWRRNDFDVPAEVTDYLRQHGPELQRAWVMLADAALGDDFDQLKATGFLIAPPRPAGANAWNWLHGINRGALDAEGRRTGPFTALLNPFRPDSVVPGPHASEQIADLRTPQATATHMAYTMLHELAHVYTHVEGAPLYATMDRLLNDRVGALTWMRAVNAIMRGLTGSPGGKAFLPEYEAASQAFREASHAWNLTQGDHATTGWGDLQRAGRAAPPPGYKPFERADPDTQAEFEKLRVREIPEGQTGKPKPDLIQDAQRFWRLATRQYEHIPRDGQHAEFAQSLRMMEKAPQVARFMADLDIKNVLKKLSAPEEEDFVQAVDIRDLVSEYQHQRQTLIDTEQDPDDAANYKLRGKMTPDEIMNDSRRLEADLKTKPRVAEALALRQKMWDRYKPAFIQAYEQVYGRAPKLDREDWFHHAIFDYLEENPSGTIPNAPGRGAHTPPTPGWMKRRFGSELDYSLDYRNIEAKVLSQMIRNTAKLKLIGMTDTFDRMGEAQMAALAANNAALVPHFEALAAQINATRNPALAPVTAADARRRVLNWQQARGFSMLGKIADETPHLLPDTPSGKFADLIDALGELHRENEFDKQEAADLGETFVPNQLHEDYSDLLWQYLKFLVDKHRGKPGSGAASDVFKGIQYKAKYPEKVLKDRFKTWEDFVPEGYRAWQPTPGRLLHNAWTVAQGIVNQAHEEKTATIAPGDLNQVTALGAQRRAVLIPNHIADTLESLQPKEDTPQNFVQGFTRDLVKLLKINSLYGPKNAVSYTFKRTVGDAELMLFNKGSYMHLPEAYRQIFPTLGRGEAPTPELREWLDRGGWTSTFLQSEDTEQLRNLYTLQKIAEKLPALAKAGQPVATVWKKYWSGIRVPNDIREAVVRYATYLDYLDQIRGSKQGIPQNFGASPIEEIRGLSDARDRAYKLSKDLIGSYDEANLLQKMFADWSIPFVRHYAIVPARLARTLTNAVMTPRLEAQLGQKMGTAAGVKLAGQQAVQVGRWVASVYAFTAGTAALNHLLHPQQEENMPPEVRGRAHLDLGEWGNQLYSWNRFGVNQDGLSMFGLDNVGGYYEKIAAGRMTPAQALGEMAKSPFKKLWEITGPPKYLYEMATGQSSGYPMHDRAEYAFDQFGVGGIYRLMKQEPARRSDTPHMLLGASASDPLENNYNEMRQAAGAWLTAQGQPPDTGHSSGENARDSDLFWARKSRRQGDEGAFRNFMAQYALDKGKDSGFQGSMKRMDPLFGMTPIQGDQFVAGLSRLEQDRLIRAYKFYGKVAAPDVPVQKLSTANTAEFVREARARIQDRVASLFPVRDLTNNPARPDIHQAQQERRQQAIHAGRKP